MFEEEPIIPNAFSPNGDGANDIFSIPEASAMVEYDLKIFNRWGDLIFHSTDPLDGWDGTYGGKEQEMTTYIYVGSMVDSEGRVIDRKGNITLLK